MPVPAPEPTPEPVDPVIELGADAASLYDPEGNATSYNEPEKAVGEKATPSWFVATAPGVTPGVTDPMNVGLNVDLGGKKTLTQLTLTTVTPGFTVTVLGATTTDPPQSVDDPAWRELGQAVSVDSISTGGSDKAGDKTLLLSLGGQSKKYRNVVLWFTAPPSAGPKVRISQLKFYD